MAVAELETVVVIVLEAIIVLDAEVVSVVILELEPVVLAVVEPEVMTEVDTVLVSDMDPVLVADDVADIEPVLEIVLVTENVAVDVSNVVTVDVYELEMVVVCVDVCEVMWHA